MTVVEAGLLAKTGMNSSGIGLATNALVTERDEGDSRDPYHMVLRAMLDAENMSDALAVVQQGFRSSSANYLVASDDGVADRHRDDARRLLAPLPQFPFERSAPSPTTSSLRRSTAEDVSLWVMPDSPFRLQRLRAGGRRCQAKAARRGFRDVPFGPCELPVRHLLPSGPLGWPRLDQGATVASVLMDLDHRRMWIADGHPCTSPFRELDLLGLPVEALAHTAPGDARGRLPT